MWGIVTMRGFPIGVFHNVTVDGVFSLGFVALWSTSSNHDRSFSPRHSLYRIIVGTIAMTKFRIPTATGSALSEVCDLCRHRPQSRGSRWLCCRPDDPVPRGV
jgi:hypothetical protein